MRDNLKAFWAEFSTYCKAVIVANLIALHTQACPQLELKPQSSYNLYKWGAQKQLGDNLKVAWAEFPH